MTGGRSTYMPVEKIARPPPPGAVVSAVLKNYERGKQIYGTHFTHSVTYIVKHPSYISFTSPQYFFKKTLLSIEPISFTVLAIQVECSVFFLIIISKCTSDIFGKYVEGERIDVWKVERGSEDFLFERGCAFECGVIISGGDLTLVLLIKD
jgi:hypothetical protein